MTIKISLLARAPHVVPVLAQWYYQEWGREAGISLEDEMDKLSAALQTGVPRVLVAMEADDAIGAIQVKQRELPQHPELPDWLGSLYLAPSHRGKGIGKLLIAEALSVAQSNGISTLHLQTEDFSGGLYRQMGWAPLMRAVNHGVDVLVMARSVASI